VLAAASAFAWPTLGRAEVGEPMARLSRYMAAAVARPLPETVAGHARLHILDTFAAMVSGSRLPPGAAALRYRATRAAPGGASVAGAPGGCAPADAALVNGVMAHADETDDSHGPSQSHPGAAIVPAALAMADTVGADGAQFLRAVTLGYDVGPRITMAMGGVAFRSESHRSTHSIAAGFGAAAAAACIAGLDEIGMRRTLDYAAQQSSGIAAWKRDTDHIEKAFVFAGMPARSGLLAATLAGTGWTGVDDVFSGDDNFFQAYAPKATPATIVDSLGERFEIARTDIKKWTVGSPIQAPLDALDLILRRERFAPDEVRDVVLRLAPESAVTVDNRDMPDVCVQHMAAVMLLDGAVSFAAAHDKARMADPAVLAVRRKVRLIRDESLRPLLPTRAAVVEVTLADGRVLAERVEAVRGTAANPMSQAEVVAKAFDLLRPVLGQAGTEALVRATLALDTASDVRALGRLLRTRR